MHSHQNQIPAVMPTGTPRLVSTACQGLLKRRAWGGLTLHLAFRSLSSHCLTPDAVFRGVLVEQGCGELILQVLVSLYQQPLLDPGCPPAGHCWRLLDS